MTFSGQIFDEPLYKNFLGKREKNVKSDFFWPDLRRTILEERALGPHNFPKKCEFWLEGGLVRGREKGLESPPESISSQKQPLPLLRAFKGYSFRLG